MTIVGLLHPHNDVTPELAILTIEYVQVRGIFKASDEVKAVLVDRTT